MGNRIVLPTCSLGAEPGVPSPQKLAEWVGEQRGRRADLISFSVEESLVPQVDAGITLPCAGGLFYAMRLQESLAGLDGDRILGELDVILEFLVDDAERAVSIAGPCRFAVPAPHLVVKADLYYDDPGEAGDALHEQYRKVFREMRDAGIVGHVCICERAIPEELEALAGRRVLFFVTEADDSMLGEILEYQQTLVVRGHQVSAAGRLKEEYEITRILVLDPGRDHLREALDIFDPDQVQVAGYSSSGDPGYWNGIADSATLRP